MTLDQFIEKGLETSPQLLRAHVKQPGFLFLYLRFRGSLDTPVLVIANVTVDKDDRGRGLFTKTLKHIKYKYPEVSIEVESVQNLRFQAHLTRLGFEPRTQQGAPQSFFLPAQKDLLPLR